MGENDQAHQNCWDHWKCSDEAKKQCPVYKTGDGKRCWIYTDNLKVFKWAMPKRDFKVCSECPWYKKHHPKN